jgi:hypothetical protein
MTSYILRIRDNDKYGNGKKVQDGLIPQKIWLCF